MNRDTEILYNKVSNLAFKLDILENKFKGIDKLEEIKKFSEKQGWLVAGEFDNMLSQGTDYLTPNGRRVVVKRNKVSGDVHIRRGE